MKIYFSITILILITSLFSANAGERQRRYTPPEPLNAVQKLGREMFGPQEERLDQELGYLTQSGRMQPQQANSIMRGFLKEKSGSATTSQRITAPDVNQLAQRSSAVTGRCRHGNPERACIQCCNATRPTRPQPKLRTAPAPAPPAVTWSQEYLEPRQIGVTVQERDVHVNVRTIPGNVYFHGDTQQAPPAHHKINRCAPVQQQVQQHRCGSGCGHQQVSGSSIAAVFRWNDGRCTHTRWIHQGIEPSREQVESFIRSNPHLVFNRPMTEQDRRNFGRTANLATTNSHYGFQGGQRGVVSTSSQRGGVAYAGDTQTTTRTSIPGNYWGTKLPN